MEPQNISVRFETFEEAGGSAAFPNLEMIARIEGGCYIGGEDMGHKEGVMVGTIRMHCEDQARRATHVFGLKGHKMVIPNVQANYWVEGYAYGPSVSRAASF